MTYSSCSATSVAKSASPKSHQPPIQTSQGTIGTPTIATSTRETNGFISSAAEPAPPGRIVLERLPELFTAEVRPERLGEDELGVRDLPQEEVRDAELPRGPDQQVRIGQVGREQ